MLKIVRYIYNKRQKKRGKRIFFSAILLPLRGDSIVLTVPRVLPWADEYCPYGASFGCTQGLLLLLVARRGWLEVNQSLCVRCCLFDVVDHFSESVPSYAGDAVAVGVGAPPDEDGFSDDVVFGNESPVA